MVEAKTKTGQHPVSVNDLHRYIAGASRRKQSLGHFDCVRFVTECLYIGWGKDYRGDLDYWDRRSAVRRLRNAGGLHNAICDLLGNPISELDFGDVAYYEEPATIGIVMPTSVLVFIGGRVHRLHRESAIHGWKA